MNAPQRIAMNFGSRSSAGLMTQALDWLLAGRTSLSLRARIGRDRYVRSVYGPYLRHTPDDRTFELCTTGYGRFVADVIRNHAGPFVFLDIGANCGVFSLVAARHPRCESVIAIEPVPETFAALEANIAFNRAHKVRAVRAAVSLSDAGEVSIDWNPAHSGMASMVRRGGPRTVSAPVLGAAGLAALVGRPAIPIFAKIDVEGAEAEVLAVLAQCPFAGDIADILIEVSERNCGVDGAEAVHAALIDLGHGETGRDGPPDHYDAHYRRLPPGGFSR